MVKPVQNRALAQRRAHASGPRQHMTVPWSCETITGLAVVYLTASCKSSDRKKSSSSKPHMAKEIPEHTEPTLAPRMDDLLE